MPDHLPTERFAEIREREQAATKGPWSPYGTPRYEVVTEADFGEAEPPAVTHGSDREADAEFIAHARQDIPDLLAEVEKLHTLIRDLTDTDPCWFDHHGGCQAHGYLSLEPGELCPHAEAKQLLGDPSGAAS